MGLVMPAPDFLPGLRAACDRCGALLILDEVITGFRFGPTTYGQLAGIRPDLTTLGKIVGGGLPLGAYGGRHDIMDQVLPAGKVFQAGTLSGNPIATAAGIATLKLLRDQPPYDYLDQISARMAQGLAQAADDAGLAYTVRRVGSMMTLFFNPEPVTNWQIASRCDTARFARYFWGLADRGVYMPCSQYEALFVSAAHTPDDIEQTLAAAADVLQQA